MERVREVERKRETHLIQTYKQDWRGRARERQADRHPYIQT